MNGLSGATQQKIKLARASQAIVCRWAEQTSKGNMWDDIVPAILEMACNPESARSKAPAAQKGVQRHLAKKMAILRDPLR
ncbi:hypothetical protein Enr13x_08590 [Stieleria neptunia]|uniref:Uncharacterized protein n=1 Tax=Stieleria neptunia TaxID=2527979 RepID=A0A518HJL8_9BACT|nr:hypothetical protein [Stieleria neptunia]QDV41021.1 hypothetical protein Enr13x_08590 [Stieleria neptunia]